MAASNLPILSIFVTHLSPASPSPIKGTVANLNSVDPDQTPQNAASDQGLHCLH